MNTIAHDFLSQRRIGELMWQKAILGMVPIEHTADAKLLSAVISTAISDAERAEVVPFQTIPEWIESTTCKRYCSALGIAHESLLKGIRSVGRIYADVANVRIENNEKQKAKRRAWGK